MSQDIYRLKKYIGNNEYTDFSENLILRETSNLNYINFYLFADNKPTLLNFNKLELPKRSYDDLKNLLNFFNLNSYLEEFISFMSYSQQTYLLYNNEFDDELEIHFLYEKKELSKLLNILELYLFGKKTELHSISFKFQTKSTSTQTIKNFFVVDDIYKSLLNYFKLTESNFFSRKKELIEEYTNSFNYKKGTGYVIMKVVQALFSFLKRNLIDISDNKALRFCGVFLHICQIPSNKNSDDISIGDINDSLEIIDYQNLMHLKKGRLKTSL